MGFDSGSPQSGGPRSGGDPLQACGLWSVCHFFCILCGLRSVFLFFCIFCGLWSVGPFFLFLRDCAIPFLGGPSESFLLPWSSVGCGLSAPVLWGFHTEGSAEFRRGTRYVSTADRQKHLLLI